VRQKHGYLICKKKITLKTCRAKNFRYDKLEDLILNTSHELDLSRVMQDDGVTLKLRQKEDEIAAREKEVSDLKARIEGLIDLLETAKAETRQDFQDRLSKRTAERDRLRGVLTALRREREVLEQERAQQSAGPKSVARLRAELENASGEALYTMRRKLAKPIHSFVDDLRFHADGSVEVVAYGGLVRRSWNLETGSIMLVYDTEFLRSRARAWPTSGSSC